jgi:hypothetical protein
MRQLLATAILATLATGSYAADKAATLPPCETEDSINCFWDATARGNGKGQSFIDVDGSRISLAPFLLVELSGSSVRILERFELPGHCFKASLDHALPAGATFATCVGTDEASEEAMAAYVAFEYGLIEGDF